MRTSRTLIPALVATVTTVTTVAAAALTLTALAGQAHAAPTVPAAAPTPPDDHIRIWLPTWESDNVLNFLNPIVVEDRDLLEENMQISVSVGQ
ncbi:hypothetical protein [Nonomuraea basaltis]|uniref:hypothetical protein n=1 Tax=Nonomuraea basaltis TaxID=2495887 RepID=UPI00110C691B|nr:hypothetical protein [Nonomuraea basaltis]TMR88855.1 hypothetical protein EJK15_63955 [Nonomuraea basaltis]